MTITDTDAQIARALGAFNATTGEMYRGGNIERLAEALAVGGYDPAGGWAGFRQWIDAGRVVRKGQHGTPCLTVVTVGADENGHGGTTKPRGFRVFHRDQTDELADQPAKREPETWHAPNVDLLLGA